jgi:hypothetical protein
MKVLLLSGVAVGVVTIVAISALDNSPPPYLAAIEKCRDAASKPDPHQALTDVISDLSEPERDAAYQACTVYQSGYADGLKEALRSYKASLRLKKS